MRTQPQQFPHIYRFLSAGADLLLQRYESLPSNRKQLIVNGLPFVIVILYLLFSVFSPSSEFDQARLAVLKNPKSAQAHLNLSRIFKESNDLIKASDEVMAANLYAPQNEGIKEEITKLSDLKNKPGQLKKDFEYWEKISEEYQGFRDAFLQKAALMYQLKNMGASKKDLQHALELDPNYEPALKIKALLGF